ncbi:MAG TPA: PKD domain-containing protein [Pyrinomonadaceae bacterium]|nr:PKD domain-containing protein [Pyrinomonadaceae bacterium]
MLRTFKMYRKLLTPLFILVISISIFFPFSSPSSAQKNSCPANLLKNGDFSAFTINGSSNFPPSSVADWSAAFRTPQIATALGCDGKPGFISMWGNKVVGEGVQQTNVAIQAGHTYRLSACVKVDVTNPALPKYVRFNVRASNGPFAYSPTVATAPTIGIIGDATNSPVSNPQGITSTTWTPVSLGNWTAPANFNTITINPENDSTLDDGGTVSWGHLDNVCLIEVFKPDFPPPPPVCQGQPMSFTSNVAGATSWNWNFGDNTPNSTQQNPGHTYANAGTYNVTLCVNGATNCVTKPVTVKAAPPVPVITGPSSSCGLQTATYSVPAVSGVLYSWSVTNGTINGPSTGNSVSVTWNPNGTGTISVTVTNKGGCSSSARMLVSCDLHQGECCLHFQSKTDLKSLVHLGSGLYDFTANLSVSMPNITRVTANVISSSLTYAPSSCGVAGPVNSYVTSALPAGSFTPSIPVTNGREVIWFGPATNISGIPFTMQIKFPPPPSGACRDFLTFCVKYTFGDKNCKHCEVIRCYGPFKRGGPIKDLFDEVKDIKSLTTTR